MANTEFLEEADEYDIRRKSSINQYGAFLSILKGGVRVPISFDVIDWIDCKGIKSHRAIVSNGTDLGYNYPIREYTYFTDAYLIGDRNEVKVEKLPHWFGEGWHEKVINDKVFVNFDNGSLGNRQKNTLRIGLDYVESDEMLDNADE